MDFNAALVRFKPLISKLARKFSFNYTQQEDMEQILTTELWSALAVHNNNLSNLNTFVHNRLKWIAINTIKKNNRENENTTSLDPTIHANNTSYNESHESQELFDFLDSRLDERSQQIVSLAREGYTHQEIGNLLELSTQRVQQIMSDVKDLGQQLRKII